MFSERYGSPPGVMNRRDFLRLGGAGLAGAVLLGAGGRALARTGPSLRTELESAASEYGVPAQLLLAMSYYNTLWEMPPPEASDYEKGDIEGRGAYGIMQLEQNPVRDTLGKAASLTGLSEEALKNDRAANVRGGAALLSDLVGATRPSDLDGWQEAVAGYADFDLYASAVFEVLKNGASLENSKGELLTLEPQSVEVPQVYELAGSQTDYPRARWRPAHSSNYTGSRRERSYNINRVVIHVVQGSYSSAIRWFKNASADVSSHYVVSRRGRVAQCVKNKNIAWHAGNWDYNCRSIGIEHAGYVNNPRWFTKRMYAASARLTAWCCKRHKIPVDRRYIIGHSQVPGATHTDPGRYWNWDRYMKLVRYYRRRL